MKSLNNTLKHGHICGLLIAILFPCCLDLNAQNLWRFTCTTCEGVPTPLQIDSNNNIYVNTTEFFDPIFATRDVPVIIKLSSQGQQVWRKRLWQSTYPEKFKVLTTALDKDFLILAGIDESNQSRFIPFIAKMQLSNGQITAYRLDTFQIYKQSFSNDVKLMIDAEGNYNFAYGFNGTSPWFVPDCDNIALMRFDKNLNLIKTQIISGEEGCLYNSSVSSFTKDGGFIYNDRESYIGSDSVRITKLKSNWQTIDWTYKGTISINNSVYEERGFLEGNNGAYFYTHSAGLNSYISKLTPQGRIAVRNWQTGTPVLSTTHWPKIIYSPNTDIVYLSAPYISPNVVSSRLTNNLTMALNGNNGRTIWSHTVGLPDTTFIASYIISLDKTNKPFIAGHSHLTSHSGIGWGFAAFDDSRYTQFGTYIGRTSSTTGNQAANVLGFLSNNTLIVGGTAYETTTGANKLTILAVRTPFRVGTSTISNALEWTVSPNPAQYEITINFINSKTNLQISLFDLLGRIVYQQKIINSSNHHISTAHLEKGTYFIKISDAEGNVEMKKLILF